VWVANGSGNSVTELNATTGALVQVISVSMPFAVSSDGTHVWVPTEFGNSVTELNAASGALVKVITAPSYGFFGPTGISSDGTNVWVANFADQTVTGFPA
jgi:DNA-binding beta-propeller fold protein YncE